MLAEESREPRLHAQIAGILVLCLTALIIYAEKLFVDRIQFNESRKTPLWIDSTDAEAVIIELRGAERGNGVYYLTDPITLGGFLHTIGYDHIHYTGAQIKLLSGDRVTINHEDNQDYISIDAIDNGKRIALGMPIPVNSATFEDLLLVPGIGEATAKSIIMNRERNGFFTRLEDLARVRGLGEKRRAELSKYLYF